MGSPLLISPEYNQDGSLRFKNNRVQAWHLGMEGELNNCFSYRLKYTHLQSWGTHQVPFRDKKKTNSGIVEVRYINPNWYGLELKAAFEADKGDNFGNALGGSLTVTNKGNLNRWN